MGNRVRLTNDTLNSYGYRVLTDGVDITQYERNPILLYMHNRGKAIGLIKDIKKENGEITGELAFDEATELSTQCKKQWDFGSLRMVSIGFEGIETSEAAGLKCQGECLDVHLRLVVGWFMIQPWKGAVTTLAQRY